jgi:hypothetical protein
MTRRTVSIRFLAPCLLSLLVLAGCSQPRNEADGAGNDSTGDTAATVAPGRVPIGVIKNPEHPRDHAASPKDARAKRNDTVDWSNRSGEKTYLVFYAGWPFVEEPESIELERTAARQVRADADTGKYPYKFSDHSEPIETNPALWKEGPPGDPAVLVGD